MSIISLPAGFLGGEIADTPFVGATVGTTIATTQTFTNHSIGAAHASRRVYVLAAWSGDGGTPACTIQGITATAYSQLIGVSPASSAAVFAADVPTGTTATIVVSGVGSINSNGKMVVAVYRVINQSAAIGSAEFGTASIRSSGNNGVANDKTAALGGFLLSFLGLGGGSSGLSFYSTPSGVTVHVTTATNYPKHIAGWLSNTPSSNIASVWSWSGVTGNTTAVWAFNP